MEKRYSKAEHQEWVKAQPKKSVGVKVLVRSSEGLVLLVKPNYRDTWQLPGGVVEADEDPKDAAVRELFEETGIQVYQDSIVAIDTVYIQDDETVLIIFEYLNRVDGSIHITVQESEITKYEFVQPSVVINRLNRRYKSFCDKYLTA